MAAVDYSGFRWNQSHKFHNKYTGKGAVLFTGKLCLNFYNYFLGKVRGTLPPAGSPHAHQLPSFLHSMAMLYFPRSRWHSRLQNKDLKCPSNRHRHPLPWRDKWPWLCFKSGQGMPCSFTSHVCVRLSIYRLNKYNIYTVLSILGLSTSTTKISQGNLRQNDRNMKLNRTQVQLFPCRLVK